MKVLASILHLLLIFAFMAAGFSKLLTPYTSLKSQPSMDWVNDFTPGFITFVSIMEIIGAFGLFLPLLVRKFEFLVPIASLMLGVVMILAAGLHISRGEPIIVNVILLALTLTVALLRRNLFKPRRLRA
jgi:uncharacterized membrane protein YphA (DoxX/SURF4 family)